MNGFEYSESLIGLNEYKEKITEHLNLCSGDNRILLTRGYACTNVASCIALARNYSRFQDVRAIKCAPGNKTVAIVLIRLVQRRNTRHKRFGIMLAEYIR